jgi:RNA polymerase sigma factor (sigma-70 family)
MTNKAEFYKANVNLVHAVARKGHARLTAANVGIDYEDVFQEMSVVFLKAYEHFDASLGFQFSTFFYRSAYNRLNKWATDLIDERLKHGVVSIDELNDSGDGESALEEVLMVDPETPEENCRVTQLLEHIARTLSPLANLILTWAVAPPKELLDEVRKVELNAEFGRSIGLNVRCMTTVNPRFVSRFIQMISDVSQAEINKALKEIDTLRYSETKRFIGV